MARGLKLVGLRASSGHKMLTLKGWPITVAMEPLMEETKGIARPTKRNICKTHQTPLKQALYCPSAEKDHPCVLTKAVEVSKDVFVEVDEGEMAELGSNEEKHVIELKKYIDNLDPIYIEQTYLIWPDSVIMAKPFAAIAGALEANGGAVLGLDQNEHGTMRVIALTWSASLGVMVAHKCFHESAIRRAHADEIREAISTVPMEIEDVTEGLARLQSLQKENEDFDLTTIEDTLGKAQWEYVHKKAREQLSDEQLEETPDLMESLRATLKEAEEKRSKPKSSRKSSTTKKKESAKT